MVRENRVKDVSFDGGSAISITGSTQAVAYSDNVINGEILKIRFPNVTSPGSIWLAESGVDIEIFRKNDFASGDATAEFYPFVYPVDATNTTGSPNAVVNRVINGPIYYAGSGFTSGTSKTWGPITVFYR